jgi:hypothetical protein
MDTTACTLECDAAADGWHITARSGDGLLCTLVLSPEAEVLLYDGTPALGQLTALSWLHTLAAPSDGLDRYAAAFANACLPGRSIVGATPVDDLSTGDGAHLILTTLTGAEGEVLPDGLALMIEPQVKVVMYEQKAMEE